MSGATPLSGAIQCFASISADVMGAYISWLLSLYASGALQVFDSFPKSYTPQSRHCPLLSATFAYGAPRLGFAQ